MAINIPGKSYCARDVGTAGSSAANRRSHHFALFVRPVTAYFDEDGNICREHVESEDRGRRMTNNEVKTVLDEIAVL